MIAILHKGSQPTGPREPPKGMHNADPQSQVGLAPNLCSLELRGSAVGKGLHFSTILKPWMVQNVSLFSVTFLMTNE